MIILYYWETNTNKSEGGRKIWHIESQVNKYRKCSE